MLVWRWPVVAVAVLALVTVGDTCLSFRLRRRDVVRVSREPSSSHSDSVGSHSKAVKRKKKRSPF